MKHPDQMLTIRTRVSLAFLMLTARGGAVGSVINKPPDQSLKPSGLFWTSNRFYQKLLEFSSINLKSDRRFHPRLNLLMLIFMEVSLKDLIPPTDTDQVPDNSPGSISTKNAGTKSSS